MKKVFFSCSYENSVGKEIYSILKNKTSYLDIKIVTPDDCLFNDSSLSSSIIQQINGCSLFVCVYDSKSPNITFELGYAIGRNKKVVLVAYHDELPFDIRHLCYINKELPCLDISQSIITFIENETINDRDLFEFKETTDPDEKLEQLLKDQELLDAIDGKEFEHVVLSWFERHGFETHATEKFTDYGYDFIAKKKNGALYLVEVKKYSANSNSRVSVGTINKLLGAMSAKNISHGIIVSTSEYTKSAEVYALASEKKVRLLTLKDLAECENSDLTLIRPPAVKSKEVH